jgi:hypothetical protein
VIGLNRFKDSLVFSKSGAGHRPFEIPLQYEGVTKQSPDRHWIQHLQSHRKRAANATFDVSGNRLIRLSA